VAQVKLIKRLLKIFAVILLITLIIYLSIIGFIFFGPSVKSYVQRTEFNSAVWKANLAPNNNIKQRMVHDLLRNHKINGLRVTEVDVLLGIPPKSEYFKECDYLYWLGPESGLGVDSEWLCLRIKNGVVEDFKILTD
jgi:hypothetical protein